MIETPEVAGWEEFARAPRAEGGRRRAAVAEAG